MKTLRNAFKVKEIRHSIYYMIAVLILIRIGSQITIPGVDKEFIQEWFRENDAGALGFFSAFTGGSFENMSIFALSITPYITSSIIMQLLTIAFPSLEEIAQDGEEGRKKITALTRFITVGLALMESIAMSIGFGRQGLIPNMTVISVLTVVFVLTGGSALLMWIGEQVTQNGIGNGISYILLVNIIAKMPQSITGLFEQFVKGKTIAKGALSAAVIICIIIAVMVFVVILENATREIPVQYSRKMDGREYFKSGGSSIPLKVNTSGVIAVIFATSIMSFPGMISVFIGSERTPKWLDELNMILNQNYWFDPATPKYTVGFLIYIVLVIFFAYFYTSINFNPMMVADNLRKQAAVIPGIRPGIPTEKFLKQTLKYIVFIGAMGLLIVVAVPMALCNFFHTNISFGGTSLIIIVSVTIEIVKQLESRLAMRNYRGFVLKDKK